MDDFNTAVLTEAKNEYSAKLVNILAPLLIQGLKSIFTEACKLCSDNEENDKYLMTFQNFLTRVPKWNQQIIEAETKRIINESKCSYLEDLLTCVHITQLKVLTSIRVATKQKKIDIAIPKLSEFVHNVYIKCARKFYSVIYLFETAIQPLEHQKNMRECEIICKECILNSVRESMPIEKILRAYMDETTEEEVIEEQVREEVEVDVSENDVEKKISQEVKEEIKKATDAIKENVSKENEGILKKFGEKENVKLEIEETIKDMEKMIEDKAKDIQEVAQEVKSEAEQKTAQIEKPADKTDSSSINIDTTPLLSKSDSLDTNKTNIKFNDMDSVLNFDKTSNDVKKNYIEQVSAPKTIDRLEEISAMRNEQRKLEDEDDYDEPLKIFDDGPSLKLDALDVQILDDNLELKKPPLLTDIETLI